MTTFSINFDFTSAEQRDLLSYLQENHYELLGFKGAVGSTNQITAGVPTWFALPFGNLFGQVRIDYTPKYKIFVFNQAKIAAYTTIKMQSLSDEVALGTGLVFQPDGRFTARSADTPADSISLQNNRPAETPNITVGLAGLVNTPQGQQYLPFCAFTLTPQGTINMTPLETVALFAARVDLLSGNVQAVASTPGAAFNFSNSIISYDLQITPSTYAITNVPDKTPVQPVSSGQTLALVINK